MLMVKTHLRASSIHGLGLFSERAVPRGAVVWKETPDSELEFDEEDLARYRAESPEFASQMLRYSYRNHGRYHLCLDDSRFMNHDDDANTRLDERGDCVAVRDIAPGEEITSDYRDYYDAETLAHAWGTEQACD